MRRRLVWLVIPLGWALACGGRYQRGSDDEGDVGGSSNAQGGSGPSRAGTQSTAGSPVSGGAPTAGTSSVGGVASMPGGCACDPVACAPGYTAVPTPGNCCFECVLDLQSCRDRRAMYASYRDAVVSKFFPYKCETSMDCTYYYDRNECQAFTCGYLVNHASLPAIDAELNAVARATCNPSCPTDPVPPCVAPSEPVCFKGYCE